MQNALELIIKRYIRPVERFLASSTNDVVTTAVFLNSPGATFTWALLRLLSNEIFVRPRYGSLGRVGIRLACIVFVPRDLML